MDISKRREIKLPCEFLDQWSDSGVEETLWILWKSVRFRANHNVGRFSEFTEETFSWLREARAVQDDLKRLHESKERRQPFMIRNESTGTLPW